MNAAKEIGLHVTLRASRKFAILTPSTLPIYKPTTSDQTNPSRSTVKYRRTKRKASASELVSVCVWVRKTGEQRALRLPREGDLEALDLNLRHRRHGSITAAATVPYARAVLSSRNFTWRTVLDECCEASTFIPQSSFSPRLPIFAIALRHVAQHSFEFSIPALFECADSAGRLHYSIF